MGTVLTFRMPSLPFPSTSQLLSVGGCAHVVAKARLRSSLRAINWCGPSARYLRCTVRVGPLAAYGEKARRYRKSVLKVPLSR